MGREKMKKKLWKIWQRFLLVSVPLNIFSLVICACCLDSESIIPIIIGTINLLWIALIVVANTDEESKRKDRKHNGIKDQEYFDAEFQGDKAANL